MSLSGFCSRARYPQNSQSGQSRALATKCGARSAASACRAQVMVTPRPTRRPATHASSRIGLEPISSRSAPRSRIPPRRTARGCVCSFSSPGDGAGPYHTAEHPSARRVVCADSGPKPLGPRARRHRASQLRNGRGSRRRATPRVRDPVGLPRTALWVDGHRTGRFVASIPCRRARASATSTAATSKPPARPPFTHHKQTPHTAAAAARARCRAPRRSRLDATRGPPTSTPKGLS